MDLQVGEEDVRVSCELRLHTYPTRLLAFEIQQGHRSPHLLPALDASSTRPRVITSEMLLFAVDTCGRNMSFVLAGRSRRELSTGEMLRCWTRYRCAHRWTSCVCHMLRWRILHWTSRSVCTAVARRPGLRRQCIRWERWLICGRR